MKRRFFLKLIATTAAIPSAVAKTVNQKKQTTPDGKRYKKASFRGREFFILDESDSFHPVLGDVSIMRVEERIDIRSAKQ